MGEKNEINLTSNFSKRGGMSLGSRNGRRLQTIGFYV